MAIKSSSWYVAKKDNKETNTFPLDRGFKYNHNNHELSFIQKTELVISIYLKTW